MEKHYIRNKAGFKNKKKSRSEKIEEKKEAKRGF